MLISPLPLLERAQTYKFAIPAFNFNQMETVKAVMSAAVEAKSPIILQTSPGAVEYAGFPYLIAIANAASTASVPVVLHFDHGKETHISLLKEAILQGYSSIMFDGSGLPLEENIRQTRQMVKLARQHGVAVEAELGRIRGKEDVVDVKDHEAFLTDPEEAARFVRETECDSLAIAIGTAHGAYKFKDDRHINLERLEEIAKHVRCPLVLHGASGVREDMVALAKRYGADLGSARGVLDSDIQAAIQRGICKVNIDTDLRIAYSTGVHEAITKLPSVIDPRELMKPSLTLMQLVAKQKINLFGSANQA